MSKVHTFPLITTLYADTRLPLQYPGGGNAPEALQVELDVLRAYIQDNLNLSTTASVSASTYTFSIPEGCWLVGIAVESASAQTFKCGLSAGTDELIYEGIVGAGDVSSFGVLLYGGTAGKTIYFSALSGSTLITFLLL